VNVETYFYKEMLLYLAGSFQRLQWAEMLWRCYVTLSAGAILSRWSLLHCFTTQSKIDPLFLRVFKNVNKVIEPCAIRAQNTTLVETEQRNILVCPW